MWSPFLDSLLVTEYRPQSVVLVLVFDSYQWEVVGKTYHLHSSHSILEIMPISKDTIIFAKHNVHWGFGMGG